MVAECDQALTECAWLQATLEEANKAMESPQSAPQSEQSLATVGARVAAAEEKVDRVVEAVEEVVMEQAVEEVAPVHEVREEEEEEEERLVTLGGPAAVLEMMEEAPKADDVADKAKAAWLARQAPPTWGAKAGIQDSKLQDSQVAPGATAPPGAAPPSARDGVSDEVAEFWREEAARDADLVLAGLPKATAEAEKPSEFEAATAAAKKAWEAKEEEAQWLATQEGLDVPTFAVAVDPAVVEAASAVLGRPVAARPAVASRR